jgi:preprotein translocase subunit SecG
MSIQQILFFVQIAVSVILIILIAVQQRGAALGSGFGGGGEFYASRRGIQKKIFYATMVVAALFIALGIVNLLIK